MGGLPGFWGPPGPCPGSGAACCCCGLLLGMRGGNCPRCWREWAGGWAAATAAAASAFICSSAACRRALEATGEREEEEGRVRKKDEGRVGRRMKGKEEKLERLVSTSKIYNTLGVACQCQENKWALRKETDTFVFVTLALLESLTMTAASACGFVNLTNGQQPSNCIHQVQP